jgi:hypothetical protein
MPAKSSDGAGSRSKAEVLSARQLKVGTGCHMQDATLISAHAYHGLTFAAARQHSMAPENPWLHLPRNACILPADRNSIEEFNRGKSTSKQVALDLLPEPFIGNPDTARVVLLGLNPGHSDDDHKDQHKRAFRAAIRLNLRHEALQYPFYPLDPRFADTGAGKWWCTHLKPLMKETQLDPRTLSQRLMVIEWFPYHSTRSGLPSRLICPSQKYSFALAKMMLQRRVPIIGMRSRDHWALASRRLGKQRYLSNCRRAWISRGNVDNEALFDGVLRRLKDQ